MSPVESPTVATCPSRASEGEAHGKIGEKLAAQLTQASKVASSRSNSLLEESSGGPKWAWLIRQAFESVVFHLTAKPICWLSEHPLSATLLG
ncbi:hypothetical protein HKD37_04G010756 [Glycine soja]